MVTATATLFVLLPPGLRVAAVLDAAPAGAQLVTYGPADDRHHLLSLVRARRDRRATRWLRGLLLCIGTGALLGLLVNGVLAGAFGMFGGLLQIALPLGLVLGAFLGGFTAAMTGTEVARDEVRRLVHEVPRGATLLQASAAGREQLQPLRAWCTQAGVPCVWRD